MKKLSLLLAAACLAGSAGAADLLQVYRLALDNDPQFLAARHQADAGREKEAQGLSGLLPTLGASANTQWNDLERKLDSSGVTAKAQYNSNGYTVTLTQPLFRWQNVVTWQQGRMQAAQAEAQFAQAKQDVILRVAQAYFDVLYAEENLRALQAQKKAIAQQLEQAKKNFEVGTATIVDTHEAQSRFDLATAQEIAADSDLEIKRRALEVVVGRDPGALAQLRDKAALERPRPDVMARWVEAAEKDAIAVQLQQLALEVAAKEVEKSRAGHYPTLDAVVAHGNAAQSAALPLSTGPVSPGFETRSNTAALQLNIPLFQGGFVNSKTREAAASREAARQQLEAARRNAAQAARQAYLGVANGTAQVAALKAALVSSQSSLESNRLGYEVGVRIGIDVLNAEQQLYATRRDLAKAWYDTLLAQLRLKSAVGTLEEADLAKVNALLAQ
ncbi:TolC family outer membrane protein [Azospira restricta]|uniref:TolC family outer membrane protein n=1 Tax=Azospira restricta TaxID=404405 RepID=A0A974SPH2_9RHOO|nr:TolC family outer membrane protein [Azospira restricta]QRJ64081.1 TolC family outer membrane protein [Azospira restricta]